MSEALKVKLRGRCASGRHVDGPMAPVDGKCMNCSTAHVDEFCECVGVVLGPVDFNRVSPGDPAYDPAKVGPEVDVRWLPSNLRYMFGTEDLELVS